MPSMSYCAFENTTLEMAQILGMMEEAESNDEPLDLNKYEAMAFERLKEQCALFLEACESIEYTRE